MKNETNSIREGGLEVPGYLSYPAAAKGPAVIVIHEIWGLNENIQDIADRFAGEGYLAFAPDLLTGEMKEFMDPSIMREMADPAKKDEAQKKMRTALAPTHTPEFAKKTLDKLEACSRFLKNHAAST